MMTEQVVKTTWLEMLKQPIAKLVDEVAKKGLLIVVLLAIIYWQDFKNRELDKKIVQQEVKLEKQNDKIEQYWRLDREEMVSALNRNAEVIEMLLVFLKTKTDYSEYNKIPKR